MPPSAPMPVVVERIVILPHPEAVARAAGIKGPSVGSQPPIEQECEEKERLD